MRDSKGRSDPLKVAVKYCGGCRAQYDRVEAVNTIKDRLGPEVAFFSAEEKDVQLLLVVNGCASACATVDSATELPIRFIASPEDTENDSFGTPYPSVNLSDPTG